MRNESGSPEVVGRGVLKPSAKGFRRAGHPDRSILRASHLTPPHSQTLKHIYWHRELPPLDAQVIDEHVVEAVSRRVSGTLAHRDELWNRCYEDLMAQARTSLEKEIARLGGNYAHVLGESVDSRHDGATSDSWLHGRFTYMLYRQPANG